VRDVRGRGGKGAGSRTHRLALLPKHSLPLTNYRIEMCLALLKMWPCVSKNDLVFGPANYQVLQPTVEGWTLPNERWLEDVLLRQIDRIKPKRSIGRISSGGTLGHATLC
jgi:hypothetical protein